MVLVSSLKLTIQARLFEKKLTLVVVVTNVESISKYKESGVIHSHYATYFPPGHTIIDGGFRYPIESHEEIVVLSRAGYEYLLGKENAQSIQDASANHLESLKSTGNILCCVI